MTTLYDIDQLHQEIERLKLECAQLEARNQWLLRLNKRLTGESMIRWAFVLKGSRRGKLIKITKKPNRNRRLRR